MPDRAGATASDGRTGDGDGDVLPASDDPFAWRDPDFIRRQIGAVDRYLHYFSPVVRGLENLPDTGPVLVVGNHSCLFWMPDVFVVARSISERRGLDIPSYALGYDLLFRVPGLGTVLRRLGALPASDGVARRALDSGALVLVYPGGDREAARPWSERDRIDFGGRRGFIRLALRAGVPVVPVVAHGSHHAIFIASSGERLAHAVGLDRLRIKVLPVFLTPLGFTSVLRPPLPLPAAVTVQFLPALDWRSYGSDAAADDRVVDACYDEITCTMQSALDGLAAELPHPVLRGIGRLLAGRGLTFEDVPPAR